VTGSISQAPCLDAAIRSDAQTRSTRIAYCGPIAQPGEPARGGYESANRRLIDDLRRRGRDVIELPYPVTRGTQATKGLAYLRRFAGIALEIIRQRNNFDVLHLTPLYRGFLYPEAMLCLIAWALGKRVLFDIRAGYFIELYGRYGSVYRALTDALLRHVDTLAVEGKEYFAFMEARRERPIVYLPNYVSVPGAEASGERIVSTRGPIRLVFLGRIVPEKGIEKVIGALEALLGAGLDTTLEVIGSGEADYLARLQDRTNDLPVIWAGPLSPEETRLRAAQAQFFVFPSSHLGEGHSNALTEAMAEGLVPVCSEQGFNRSVVADAGRVLPVDASAAEYAEAIAELWQTGAWVALSAAARARIVTHFTGDVVLSDLIASYDTAPVTRS
jgi:glycosyltransferase involved in cell wall biosynthesis